MTATYPRALALVPGVDLRHMTHLPSRLDGGFTCWRCLCWYPVGTPWDLGHDDHDRTQYRGPECRPCNRATASRFFETGAEQVPRAVFLHSQRFPKVRGVPR